jgi:hypothetical protein
VAPDALFHPGMPATGTTPLGAAPVTVWQPALCCGWLAGRHLLLVDAVLCTEMPPSQLQTMLVLTLSAAQRHHHRQLLAQHRPLRQSRHGGDSHAAQLPARISRQHHLPDWLPHRHDLAQGQLAQAARDDAQVGGQDAPAAQAAHAARTAASTQEPRPSAATTGTALLPSAPPPRLAARWAASSTSSCPAASGWVL